MKKMWNPTIAHYTHCDPAQQSAYQDPSCGGGEVEKRKEKIRIETPDNP
jgi:hypothetical protein